MLVYYYNKCVVYANLQIQIMILDICFFVMCNCNVVRLLGDPL